MTLLEPPAPGHGLPGRLRAPAPGWTSYADVLVIGSGVAGLTVALRSAASGSVMVVTKDVLSAGSTQWAQGGIAAALGPGDTPEAHRIDTLTAGVGLCDEGAVDALVNEGPDSVLELIGLGAEFDRRSDGTLSLGREGGHHADRIAHAGGDATGAEVQRALVDAVRADPRIEVIEHALALDLLLDDDGAAAGVTLHVIGQGARDGVGAVHSKAVVLATGGIGQVYSATTNPVVSTGDGLALALRAGAAVRDLEFVQFHPTVMWLGAGSKGQQPLVSEAVRGEGAFLVDHEGRRIMAGLHPLADLAPRDVVAKAIMRRMIESGVDHVWLDARALGEDQWRTRFPTILASCLQQGIEPWRQLIPVAPASHYVSGGVRTDLWGRTSVPGLYACGEVAWTGVHGANRLASNSLLEGLVFARRIAQDLADRLALGLPRQEPRRDDGRPMDLFAASTRASLQQTMTAGAGVLRTADSLKSTDVALSELRAEPSGSPGLEAWEATNLHVVAAALVAGALRRQETRGSHWREDFPERDDEHWLGHLDVTLDPGLTLTYERKA